MESVSKSWDRIHAWLKTNAPQVFDKLNPGASEDKIKKLKDKLGVNDLPEDFKSTYSIHDGSSDGFLFGDAKNSHRFHTIDEIINDWIMLKDINNDNPDMENDREEVDEEIQIQHWNPGWIPFTSNGCGDNLCIDLAPTEEGTFGQVIEWYHDGDPPKLFAKSFAEYLSKFADGLESDQYRVDKDDPNTLVHVDTSDTESNPEDMD